VNPKSSTSSRVKNTIALIVFLGDRKTLIDRIRNFAVLWNTQCDLEKPMSKMQMVMRINKDEKNLFKTKKVGIVVGPIKQLFDKLINFHYLKLIDIC
jgi:hypothetical protein